MFVVQYSIYFTYQLLSRENAMDKFCEHVMSENAKINVIMSQNKYRLYLNLIGCLHDQTNIEQTSSKHRAGSSRLLEPSP